MQPVRRALLSVYDKTGLTDFARRLVDRGITLISTGGTAAALREAGLPVTPVQDVTGFPEMLDGRVKTLHPAIHGAILARRDKGEHVQALAQHGLDTIDLVVVNLYPFAATIAKPGVTLDQAIEQIDIGGPSMLRSAAKNHASVGVVTSPADYDDVLSALDAHGGALPDGLRRQLAAKAFSLTASYDAAITTYLGRHGVDGDEEPMPTAWALATAKRQSLRYGENPHQAAALYGVPGEATGLALAQKLQGKGLSYNNWLDMDGAYRVARDLGRDGIVVVKHTNPCGAARSSEGLLDAYEKARACDPVSAFGGIVATRGIVDEPLAAALAETFLEVVLAQEVTDGARDLLSQKKRLRVLTLDEDGWLVDQDELAWRAISGGLLLQQADHLDEVVREANVVTERSPTDDEWAALEFGWTLCRHVKSNAIVFSQPDRTAAIGAGQMSRVDAARLCVMKATGSLVGTAVASDAFFPFADGVEAAAEAGATAIVQPGGSMRDAEVIDAADRLGLTMVFTGRRHFRH